MNIHGWNMRGPRDILCSWRYPWASLLALPALVLLWQSLFWFGRVPVATKAAYAGLTVLSALRPAQGLAVVAALATLGGPIALMVGAPQGRTAEPVLLAFLVGWLVHSVVRRESILARDDSLSAPIALFALAVSASLVVMTVAVQSATAPPWPYLRLAASLLARDYFGEPHFETHNWAAAALLVEGGLLMTAVLHLARRRPDLQGVVARMLAIGIVSAAILSLSRLGMALVRATDPGAFLRDAFTSIRLSVHTADLNAAGSHFVLALPLLWALGLMAGRWRPVWMLSLVPVVAALWLTGSRAAQFSILLVVAAGIATAAGRRARVRSVLVVVALIIAIVAVIIARPRPDWPLMTTLRSRWLFLQLSWDMLKSAPLFGVGIGEYWGRSTALMPEGLRAIHVAENAHNNFAQIGVELGVTGLGLFLWLLAAAWRRIRQGLLADPDPLLRGLVLGLATALLTFLTGHPLLISAFAASFWIALGLAVVRADTLTSRAASVAPPASARAGRAPRGRWRSGAVAAAMLVLVGSMPFRASLAPDAMNLSGVRYGFDSGGVDPVSHDRFQWAGPRATIFAPAHARSLYLSVSSPAEGDALELEVRIDGRLADRIGLRDGLWLDMRLILPVTKSAHAYRRIDFTVTRSADGHAAGSSPRDGNDPRVRVRTLGVE